MEELCDTLRKYLESKTEGHDHGTSEEIFSEAEKDRLQIISGNVKYFKDHQVVSFVEKCSHIRIWMEK